MVIARWGAVARSLHGKIDIMFGPVITTEAHLALACARTHSNNTAEMSAMIEALFFLGPHDPVARDANSCVMTPNMLPVLFWTRVRPARMYNLRLLAKATVCHASCEPSYRKSGKRMCKPCFHGALFGVQSYHSAR